MSPYGNVQCSISKLLKENRIILECVNKVLWGLQVYLEETAMRANAKILLGEKAGTQPPRQGRRNHRPKQYEQAILSTASREIHRVVILGYDSQRKHSTEEVKRFSYLWSKPAIALRCRNNIFPTFSFQTLNPKTMCEFATMNTRIVRKRAERSVGLIWFRS
jgi:hypothetical protein